LAAFSSSPASQVRPAFARGAADGGRARRGGLGRRVYSRNKLLQTPCNTENAVKGAIPKSTNLKNFFDFSTQQ